MESENIYLIPEVLKKLYPNTKTFLNYTKDYELLFAIILSAQATDESVNKATAILFEKYKTLDSFIDAKYSDIYEIIKPVGLAKSKTNYLLDTAKIIKEKYGRTVPKDREKLCELKGVGYKTSGVFLGELYDYPYFPVDTHVMRVSTRLGLVKKGITPDECEKKLEKIYKEYHLIELHRQFILFGRNICLSRKPSCYKCPFYSFCKCDDKQEKSGV